MNNEPEEVEAAPTTPQHELTLRIQLLDYLFERGHRITKPLIDAAAHFAYNYGTALYEQGKLKGQHRGNDLITEDSTPPQSDLESPLSAPTNTDELDEILLDFAKGLRVIDEDRLNRKISTTQEGYFRVEEHAEAKAKIAHLIVQKQIEELENILQPTNAITHLDRGGVSGNYLIDKVNERIAQLKGGK
jgi:hypothetical protein